LVLATEKQRSKRGNPIQTWTFTKFTGFNH
jgi:hypothetical protein